jgi:uroporphyrinogen-III synthase
MLVLITRSGKDADELAGLLTGRGLQSIVEPMINPRFLRDGDLDTRDAQGFLVTSTNGARGLAKATERRDLPVFAIGSSPAKSASDAGFTEIVKTSGDAGDLVLLVKDRLDPAGGVLIHASSAKPAAELKGAVEDEGFGFRHEALFEITSPDQLSDGLGAAIGDGRLDLIMFYSPLSVGVFIRLAEAAGLTEACASITLLCLSDGIANAARPIAWRQVLVPAQPNQDALLEHLDEWVASAGEV